MRIDDPNIQGDLSLAAGATSALTGSFSGSIEGNSIISGSLSGSFQGNGTELTGIVSSSINNNQISFDNLENRYTAKSTTSTTSGAVSIDWSIATTFQFTATLTGATELDFTNFKQGQVIGIYGLTGAQTITLDSDAATSETFNRIGTSEYDGTGTNFLQVACVDDSANAVFNYSIITYTSDTTP